MTGHFDSVKNRVILIVVIFAIIITGLALIFSFNIIYAFQKWSVARSTEFNLQLVANLIEQDLRELAALGQWCGYNAEIIDYFLAQDRLTSRSLDAWNKISNQYINNRAGRYVRRLLVCDTAGEKFLQVGNSLSSSIPLTIYNLHMILETGAEKNPSRLTLVNDPLYFSTDAQLLVFINPVYHPWEGIEIGTVFLGAGTGIITDKLRGYNLSAASQLYLGIDDKYYLIENERIIPENFSFTITKQETSALTGADGKTAVMLLEARDSQGRRRTLLSYPVREGVNLTHVLEPINFVLLSGAWPALAGGLGVIIIILIFMAYGVNRMTGEIKFLMNKAVIDESSKRDLEYRMLQSQIHPHFLYNTLNSIKWMATIQNATGIAEMTTALSRFLKIISKDIRKVVPLRDELALLDDYMVIQKYRYGDSVNLEKQIMEDTLLDTPIPRFILQPLVENAIFHGIEPKGSGTIVFSVCRQDDDVIVSLSDNGVGMSGEAVTGTGLNNIDERLRYTFGDNYGIKIKSDSEKGTTVIIKLPIAYPAGSGSGDRE